MLVCISFYACRWLRGQHKFNHIYRCSLCTPIRSWSGTCLIGEIVCGCDFYASCVKVFLSSVSNWRYCICMFVCFSMLISMLHVSWMLLVGCVLDGAFYAGWVRFLQLRIVFAISLTCFYNYVHWFLWPMAVHTEWRRMEAPANSRGGGVGGWRISLNAYCELVYLQGVIQ
jgi:hypothetical protein